MVVVHRAYGFRFGSVSMAGVTDAELKSAEARGQAMPASEPRASTARDDPTTGRVVIDLVNGCTYAFPAALVQDLQGASEHDLAGIRVDGLGFNVQFPALDVDLYVPALLSGIFGTRAWMARELARIAGRTTSAAKALAARANGVKGGRPRKAARG
jgi:hypothetical protein